MSTTNFNINKFFKGTGSSKLVKGRHSRVLVIYRYYFFVPVVDMTCRHAFCLNSPFHCLAVTVEEVQLFQVEMAATVETPFLLVI